MDRAGRDFLARARLAEDQNGAVVMRHLTDQAVDLGDRTRSAGRETHAGSGRAFLDACNGAHLATRSSWPPARRRGSDWIE
jgi:hypothetical protein